MKTVVLFLVMIFSCTLMSAQVEYPTSICGDSVFVYNKKGELVGKRLFAYDLSGREVMYCDYHFIDGKWIGNYMKMTYYEENKEVTVDFFWGTKKWIPGDMMTILYDDSHRKISHTWMHWVKDQWQSRRLTEYGYDKKGRCNAQKISLWDGNAWCYERTLDPTRELRYTAKQKRALTHVKALPEDWHGFMDAYQNCFESKVAVQ